MTVSAEGTGKAQTKLKGEVEKRLRPKLLKRLYVRSVLPLLASFHSTRRVAAAQSDRTVATFTLVFCHLFAHYSTLRSFFFSSFHITTQPQPATPHPTASLLFFLLLIAQAVMGDMIPTYQQQLSASSSASSLQRLEQQAGGVPQAAA